MKNFEDFSPVIPTENEEITINEDLVRENFNKLYSLNVNDKCEDRNGLTYLQWSKAWGEFLKVYPTATYKLHINPETHLPLFLDPKLGGMVFTEVTAGGITHSMWLPVLDSANKPMKDEPYTYQVWDKVNKKYIERRVEAIDSFSLNRVCWRALVKNLAMFGLGLYIYAGEDMPEQLQTIGENPQIENPVAISEPSQETDPSVSPRQTRKRRTAKEPVDPIAELGIKIASMQTIPELVNLYKIHAHEVSTNPEIMAMFSKRRQELEKAA